jgi:hypothetical protein
MKLMSARAWIRRHRKMLARPYARCCQDGEDGFIPPGGGFIPSGGGFLPAAPFREFDLFNPEPQSFPTSDAEALAAGFAGTVLAGWACQDAAGGAGATILSFSGAAAQTLTINAAATRSLIGQTATGLFDNSSFVAQKAWEIVGGATSANDNAQVASNATFDMDWTVPWSILFPFRITDGIPGSTSALLGKRQAGGGNPGWYVGVFTDGRVFGFVSDGVNPSVTTFATGNVCDGAWHWAYIRWDPVTDTLRVDTDLSTGASTNTPLITTAANTALFGFGGIPGVVNPIAAQIRGAILFGDVNTTVASIQAWWRHGRPPSWLTYTRASSFNSIVADDATIGDVLAGWATGTIAYEYNALTSTNALQLGMSSYVAGANLIPNTDLNNNTNWAPNGGTKTQYSRDSSRGFREAIKHTGTAVQNVLCAAANGAAVTAASTYAASLFIEWDGTGAAPILEVYRADGTTLIASVTVTAMVRRRVSVTFVAPATEAIRLAFVGNTGNAWAFGPMVNLALSPFARPWIFAKGGVAGTAAIAARATAPGLMSDEGTIKVWATFANQLSNQARFATTACNTFGSLNFARFLGYSSAENVAGGSYSSVGVFVAQALAAVPADIATAESVFRFWWDRYERNGWSMQIDRNNGAQNATTGTNIPTPDGSDSLINFGSGEGGANQVDGAISKVRVWNSVELAA